MNKIENPVSLSVTYAKCYRRFSETDNVTGETLEGSFQLDLGMSGKIYHQDKYTVVILDDGSKGVAQCMEGDTYSRSLGLKIAYNRALIEHLKKETRKLCHAKVG